MIFFSDRYTEEIKKLQETLDYLGVDMKITVLENDSFLPSGIFSPYEYYIAKQSHGKYMERELYYDSLLVPEYWEVRDNGVAVGIYYMGRERGKVFFRERRVEQSDAQECLEDENKVGVSVASRENIDSIEQTEEGNVELIRVSGSRSIVSIKIAENGSIISTDASRKGIVQRVEWCMENGWVYKVDFYNKYGLKYASEFRDVSGTVESKVFYSDRNQEVIVEYPGNDVVTLLENGMVKAFFNSHREFIEYYVAELSHEEKQAIFVQDEKMLDSLEIKPEGEQAWELALFSYEALLNKYTGMGGKNGVRFYAIPEHYPENKAKGEALILTNSDQIEKLEELTQELPEVTFHIAANTLVSDKLNKLGERENVNIYPCVSQKTLNDLWDKCDFYLDINHWREIHDAVNVAHQKNLLIMGFENTLHHRELLVKGCMYPAQEYKKMVLVIKYIMKSPELMQKLLLVQQRRKNAIWKDLLV